MIDKKNRIILETLRNNSRLPIKDIAKATSLRPSTVHNRIKKLIENKTIKKFTIKTDDEHCQENFIVFILINSEKQIPAKAFEDPRIKEVYGLTGEYDMIMKCKFKDIKGFNTFILDFRKLPQVKKTLTMIGTTVIKDTI